MRQNLIFLVSMLALCSLIGLLAPYYWLFDLFNHFRLHAVVASVVLGGICCFYTKRLLAVCFVILVFNGALVLQRLQDSGADSLSVGNAATRVITMIAVNVYTSNQNHSGVLTLVARENPDIVVFTETNDRWVRELSGLERDFPYHIKHPRQDNFGMAVYSKLPFESDMLSVGNYELPLAVMTFARFTLLAAHPIPPVSAEKMTENRVYLEKIAEVVQAQQNAVVLAGDLNSTLWSHSIVPLLTSGLRRANHSGYAYTWPTQMPIFAMQIDHFFAKGVVAEDFEVLESIGSDHYPVKAKIAVLEK